MLVLRERQKILVDKLMADLKDHPSILLIAPTGSGKTVMLSAFMRRLVDQNPDCKILCLVHRREISDQNLTTAMQFDLKCQIYLDRDRAILPDKNVIFSMQITAFKALEEDYQKFGKIDYVIVDEAHHINSYSYRNILGFLVRNNPELKAIGWTATPLRGDRELVSDYFKHLSDQIFLSELIESKFLVPPVIKIFDSVKKEYLCTKKVVMSIYEFFEKEAKIKGNYYRPTVAFLPSLEDCEYFTRYFAKRGFKAAYIDGKMLPSYRREILRQYACGELHVLFNYAILTEGWNEPYTSCILIVRKKPNSSVLLQMIGRGLRTLNGNEVEHENPYAANKKDCLILDYYGCTRSLPSLEQFLPMEEKKVGENPYPDNKGNGETESIEEEIERVNLNSPCYYDTITIFWTSLKATYISMDKSSALILSRDVEASKGAQSILFVTTKEQGFRVAYIGNYKTAKKISDDFIKSTVKSSFYKNQKEWGARESFSKTMYTIKHAAIHLTTDLKWQWVGGVQKKKPITQNSVCFYISMLRNNFEFSIKMLEDLFNSYQPPAKPAKVKKTIKF